MNLEKTRIKRKNDPLRYIYTVVLNKPLYHQDFEINYIEKQRLDFKTNEEKVIEFYKNCNFLLNIPRKELENRRIFKKNNIYYTHNNNTYLSNNNQTKIIDLHTLEEINLHIVPNKAVKNLVSIVKEELSEPDKLLIRNIASESFYRMLEMATSPSTKRSMSIAECIRTDKQEGTTSKLLYFGFKI